MSKRSIIGIKHLDNKEEYIYCHYNGSPEGVGRVLLNHYNDEKSVRGLLDSGNISSLEELIEKSDKKKNIEVSSQLEADCIYLFDIKKQKWTWLDVYNFNDLTLGDVFDEEINGQELFSALEKMEQYGDSFAVGIANAMFYADPIEKKKLLRAFSDLFNQFRSLD